MEGLLARGVEVDVVLPWEGPLRERLAEAGARVEVIPLARWTSHRRRPVELGRRLARNAASLRPLLRLLRDRRPDAVISNTLTIPAGATAARAAGVPHLWFVHEFGREDRGLSFDLGDRVSLSTMRRLSALVLVNSEAVRSRFVPAFGDRVRVVPYAVDVPEIERRGQVGEMPVAVQLATLAPGKGQEDAVRAGAVLAGKGGGLRLRLVGSDSGGRGAELAELARSLGVAEHVELPGFTDAPWRELAAADLSLVCSRSEAFGRATVEAMKLGTPVIGAAAGGTLELVRPGETGLLYRPGDADELAGRIEQLLGDEALRVRMAERAQTWSRETFTREACVGALLSALHEVV